MNWTARTATILTFCIAVSSSVGAVERIFDAPTLYHSDPNSKDIAVGDFNDDGILDIVQAQNYYKYIFFHIGNGDGTFQSLFPWTVHNISYPDYIEVGDLNNDGLDDLVTLSPNYTTFLSIFLSDSTSDAVPNLADTAIYYVLPSWTHYLKLADENRDGWLDILLGGDYEGPTVMHNNGDNTFADPTLIGVPPGVDVHSTDLNHDDYPDFVSLYGLTAVSITLSDGLGGYLAPDSLIPVGNAYNPPLLFDVTGDDELDLLYRAGDSTGTWIEIAVNLGDGQFDTASRFDVLLPNHLAFSVADVYGDGFADIVSVYTMGHTYAVVNNLGALTFSAPVAYDADHRNGLMQGFDFNGDGFDDLLSIGWSAMGIYMNRGDGTFPQADYFHIPPATGYNMLKMLEITSQDFDGDAYPDIAIFGQKGLYSTFDGHFFTIFYNDSTHSNVT